MSNRICFDASAALAFALTDDPNHSAAKTLIGKLAQQGTLLCAPPLFVCECDSVIRLRTWKGTLSAVEASRARAVLAALQVEIEFALSDQQRAYEIATQYDQPRVYDATYAAFAELRMVEMITADKPFFEAVNGSKCPKNMGPLTFVRLLA